MSGWLGVALIALAVVALIARALIRGSRELDALLDEQLDDVLDRDGERRWKA